MKIAIDGEVLFAKQKTGIAWNAERLVDNLSIDDNNEYQINIFNFLGLRKLPEFVKKMQEKGWILKQQKLLMWPLFKPLLFDKLHIPYSWCFGKSDVTLFFNYLVPRGVAGRSAVYVCDVNYKVYPETTDAYVLKWLNENMQTYCDRANLIITISEFSKKEIVKYLDVKDDKICVVPCGVDGNEFSPKEDTEMIKEIMQNYGISGEYFLYLGTLEPRKNIPNLIKGYKLLCDEISNAPLLVLGGRKGWQYDEIFKLVHELNLSERVVFTGYVKEADVSSLMRNAIAFVFVSKYEGFGMPPLEAMSCGTPVVVSSEAALPEVVGDSGILVEYNNPISIKDALSTFLEADERTAYSKKAMNRAKQFAWEKSSKILLDCVMK